MDSQEIELNQGKATTTDRVGGYQRRRLRVIECWYRAWADTEKVSGGTFAGEVYDEFSPGHRAEVESGDATKAKKPTMRVFVCIFTTAGMLYCGPSPYRHNRFPFTPIWGYRRGRDGLPYGLIRRLRDIQEDVNKRASKALYILSTNKVVYDEDAIPEDWTLEDWADEWSRPNAMIPKRKNSTVDHNVDRDLSQWHLELMSRSIGLIQSAAGVNDDNLGRRTNAASGIAIQRRQDQGSMTTVRFFDNLAFARQIQGEKQLSLVEQFVTEEKAFRITNMRLTPEYVVVNDGLPENDITRSKADFVISEADWRASVRQASVEQLLDAAKMWPPEVVMVMLDLIVENMDLPNREEIVRRIRSLTLQRDPDAEEPTPEELAAAQAKAAQAQMQQAAVMADVKKKVADAAKAEAQAKQATVSATQQEAQIVLDKIDSQIKALAAAREAVLSPPEVTHAADYIMHEAGFVSRSDAEAAAVGIGRLLQQRAAAAQQQLSAAQQPPPNGMPPPNAAGAPIGLQRPQSQLQ